MDLWKYLKTVKKPILMYGMGNGADKILSALEFYGVSVNDFFASDGFVRGHSFHGKRVLSYSEAVQKYGDFIILVSFATSLDEVIDRILELNRKHELYAPDVPVFGGGLFNEEYYNENKDIIERARELLSDERSKSLFDDIIAYKLSGKIDYLFNDVSTEDEIWSEILFPDTYKTTVDVGAYRGDTAKNLLIRCKNIEKVISIEPDIKNYAKLKKTVGEIGTDKIETYNVAAWNKKETREISVEGSRNSNLTSSKPSNKKQSIECVPLDEIMGGRAADYIKYDVEGAEKEALLGSIKTITEFSRENGKPAPDLLVSLYHRNEDIFELVSLVKKINPNYNLYLRRLKYIPAWDLNLYATENRGK